MSQIVATICTLLVVMQGMLPSTDAFNLQIYPRHVHQHTKTPVQVKCVAKDPITPITNCRFKTVYKQSYNLDAGPESNHYDKSYKYIGEGLDKGECGIELLKYTSNYVHDIIECQVRTEEHGWMFASSMIEIYDDDTKPPYTVSPILASVSAGSDVHVLGRSNTSLRSCSYKWVSGNWIHFDQADHLNISSSEMSLGKGLPVGDCAVVLYNVTTSGFVVFLAFKPVAGDTSFSHMTLIVPEAPEKPELTVDQQTFNEGDELKATCVINSRPLSNITWYLGDEVIRSVEYDSTRSTRIPLQWSYSRVSITQNITRRLTREDDGKELVCRAGHYALPGGRLDTKMIIRVQHDGDKEDKTTERSEHGETIKGTKPSDRDMTNEHPEHSERNEQNSFVHGNSRVSGDDSRDYGHIAWLALSLGIIAVTANLICCLVYIYRRRGDVTWLARFSREDNFNAVILKEMA